MAKKLKQSKIKLDGNYGQSQKPLDKYLNRDGEIQPRTVRAPEKLWDRIEDLAELKQVSANLLIVAALEKILDQEGII